MANWRVTFTTYEDYEVEADTEDEAFEIAERQLQNDRRKSVANTMYDEKEAECLDVEDDD